MGKYYIDLQPEGTYHLFNRAVGSEKMFRSDENCRYFLDRYWLYISPIAQTLAWCLLPNHFHLLVRFHDADLIGEWFQKKQKEKPLPGQLPRFIMQCFSNWCNCYTKSFNHMYKRKGALFMDYLRRKEVVSDEQLKSTLHYIHHNPVKHGLVEAPRDWKWSSLHAFACGGPGKQETTPPLPALLYPAS